MENQYMWATTAEHRGRDISRPEGDLVLIESETDEHYIGHWVEGFGLIGVHFPKTTTRQLSRIERDYFDGRRVTINGHPRATLRV